MTDPARDPAHRTVLAAEWVLGLAEAEDAALAERLAADDALFAAEVAHWRDRLAELDATAPERPMPDRLWPAIEAGIAAAERSAPGATAAARIEAGPVAEDIAASADAGGTVLPFRRPGGAGADAEAGDRTGLWANLKVWRGLAVAASLVAAVALSIAMRAAPRPEVVAVLLIEPGKPGAVVEAFADGRVRLVPLTDLPVPAGRALQVWTLQDKAQGPVPVGLTARARTLPLDLGTLPGPRPDQLFEITLEPETGSPTGRPTGPVLMKGLTSRTL